MSDTFSVRRSSSYVEKMSYPRAVRNTHEREFHGVSVELAGDLLSELCSPDDRLWPEDRWPLLRIDGDLKPGVIFGHGPIRYRLVEYAPGRKITFALIAPRIGLTAGFNGHHEFVLEPIRDDAVILRHEIRAQLTGIALLTWPLAICPVHNALIEDGFDKAQAVLTGGPRPRPRWSLWVRALRLVLLRLWPEK